LLATVLNQQFTMENAVVNSYAAVNLRYICIALFLALGGE